MFGVKRNTGAFISEEKDYVTETVQQLKEEVRATRRQYVSTLPVCLEVSLQSRCPCLHRICLCLDYNNIVFVYLLVCVVIVFNPCVSGVSVIIVSVCMSVCDLSIVYLVL